MPLDNAELALLVRKTLILTCSSRSAPGSTVTSATAIFVETLKVLESTILTDPPLSFVALIVDNGKEKGLGTWPCGSEGARLLVGGSIRIPYGQIMRRTKYSIRYSLEGKMYSSFEGMWSKAVISS